MSKVVDSEMHLECKAPPKKQVFSNSFSLSLLHCFFFFFLPSFHRDVSVELCVLEKVRKSEANSALMCTSPDIKRGDIPHISPVLSLRKKATNWKNMSTAWRNVAVDARGSRQTLAKGKNNDEFKRQQRSPLLWPIGCWFWPTRPSLDLSPAAASLAEGRSHLLPPLSPLHKGGPCTAKLLGSFSKSSGRIAVTHLVQASGIMDFQQEGQPVLQTENISVNKLVFRFAFDTISKY